MFKVTRSATSDDENLVLITVNYAESGYTISKTYPTGKEEFMDFTEEEMNVLFEILCIVHPALNERDPE